MDPQMILEIVGYVSTLVVLISFLMSSVIKLRVINSVGCVIGVVYAALIGAYPTVFLNGALLLINIYYLIRLTRKTNKTYSLADCKAEDGYVQYFLGQFKEDIGEYFPGLDVEKIQADVAYLVCYNAAPAGVLLGKAQEDGSLQIVLDYSTPEYRDCSVGVYLYDQLAAKGVKRLTFADASEKHALYLKKMGFAKKAGLYVKTLN